MPSPPEDTSAICEPGFRGETVMESDAAITNKDLKLPDVDVSTISRAVPEVALTIVAIDEGTSWFRSLPPVASGALYGTNRGWRASIQVLTTSRARADSMCPWYLTERAYVFYDNEDVYDSVLIEKSTGITHTTQLFYSSMNEMYYVYYSWETDYKVDGPHETVHSAKEAFQAAYKEKFGVEWTERKTTTNEKWTNVVKTYEAFEGVEDVYVSVEKTQAELFIARMNAMEAENAVIAEKTLEHVTKEALAVETEEQEALREPVHCAKCSFWYRFDDDLPRAFFYPSYDVVWERIDEENSDSFTLAKAKPLAGGRKGGRTGGSTTPINHIFVRSECRYPDTHT